MWSSSVGRLRLIGYCEGVSFLVLLGIAMPLKYFAGIPLAVRIVGMIHGVLFLWFCYQLLQAKSEHRWSAGRTATVLFAALLPFGPFVIDKRLAAAESPQG